MKKDLTDAFTSGHTIYWPEASFTLPDLEDGDRLFYVTSPPPVGGNPGVGIVQGTGNERRKHSSSAVVSSGCLSPVLDDDKVPVEGVTGWGDRITRRVFLWLPPIPFIPNPSGGGSAGVSTTFADTKVEGTVDFVDPENPAECSSTAERRGTHARQEFVASRLAGGMKFIRKCNNAVLRAQALGERATFVVKFDDYSTEEYHIHLCVGGNAPLADNGEEGALKEPDGSDCGGRLSKRYR